MPPNADTVFKEGHVYKLYCNQNENYYLGSTGGAVRQRKAQHIEASKRPKNAHLPVLAWISDIGHENVRIQIVDTHQNISRRDLLKKEDNFIKEALNDPNCLNCKRSLRPRAEYYQENKDYIKEKSRKWKADHQEQRREQLTLTVECPLCHNVRNKQHIRRHQRSKECRDVVTSSASSSQEEPHSSPSPHP